MLIVGMPTLSRLLSGKGLIYSLALDERCEMNPFARCGNEPLPFASLDSALVPEAVELVLENVAKKRALMLASDEDDKRSRLHGFDEIHETLTSLLSPLYLMAETHPDSSLREACRNGVQRLMNCAHELQMDVEMFNMFLAYTHAPVTMVPVEMRMAQILLESFQRNGLALDQASRDQLLLWSNRLSELELTFGQHISEDKSSIRIDENEMAGLPEDFRARVREEDGSLLVPCHFVNYTICMKYAESESVRKRMYVAYLNRARESNLPVLKEILDTRVEKAKLLGFEDFASYQLADKMARKPAVVLEFMSEVRSAVADKADSDYQALCAFSHKEKIEPWNRFYVAERLREQQTAIRDEELKAYFGLDQVLRGLFQLVFDLFGVNFQAAEELEVWHEDVMPFELKHDDRVIGRCYLDLFPRDNKYSHAACFDIRGGGERAAGRQLSESALVCNFSPPSGEQPALLTHSEVETLFHEFGHLMHQLMTKSSISMFAGTNVLQDFVEVPSQLFEHWAWDRTSLKSFAKHWQTQETISDELIDRMVAGRHFGSGLHIQQQLFYGALDMTYHTDAQSIGDPSSTTRRLQEAFTQFDYVENTGFETCFGHLTGYAAGYYGYLWARVFADDMFSMFEEVGVRSRDVGTKLWQLVLAKGGSVEPMDLIQKFLGRKPNQAAFRRHLGL